MAEKNGGKSEKSLQDPETGRFYPGNPGGPGRPRNEHSLTNLTRQELTTIVEVFIDPNRKKLGKRRITKMQLFIESQINRAINGDSRAAKNIWDRIEGKAIQQVILNTDIPIDAPLVVAPEGRMLKDDDEDDTGNDDSTA